MSSFVEQRNSMDGHCSAEVCTIQYVLLNMYLVFLFPLASLERDKVSFVCQLYHSGWDSGNSRMRTVYQVDIGRSRGWDSKSHL